VEVLREESSDISEKKIAKVAASNPIVQRGIIMNPLVGFLQNIACAMTTHWEEEC
jgi:hypothetical protein